MGAVTSFSHDDPRRVKAVIKGLALSEELRREHDVLCIVFSFN